MTDTASLLKNLPKKTKLIRIGNLRIVAIDETIARSLGLTSSDNDLVELNLSNEGLVIRKVVQEYDDGSNNH